MPMRRPLTYILLLSTVSAVAVVLLHGCDTLDKNPGVYCDTNADCKEAAYPICDIPDHTCLSQTDGGRPGDGGVDMAGCTSSAGCGDQAPICAAPACRACASSADDTECGKHSAATPRCGAAGACVACRVATQAQDCMAAAAPVCDATTSACRGCQAHSECASGVCKAGGICASSSEVLYVNNNAGKGCMAAGPGTTASPFCEVQAAALAAVTGSKPYVVVGGSSTAYAGVSLTATASAIGPLTIVGPGRNATPTAQLAQAAVPALAVATSGSNLTVTVDGLDLRGAGTPTPSAGVKCSVVTTGTPTLTVRNSIIQQSGAAGVDSSSCTVSFDGNVIGPSNTGGGLSLAGGSFTVSNNLIVANGTTAPGVVLSGTFSSTLWWFNTVAGNLRTGGQAGGFNCGGVLSGAPLIQASTIWGNTQAAGSSVGTGCNFTYVDIDDTTTPTGAGNFNQDPLFVSASNYRIQTGSPCKDKVTSATGLTGGTLPNHDVDNNKRPRAATGGYDCGASQAQ